MFLVLRGLPALIEIGLLIFCLIEVIQTPSDEVRGLGKGWWVLLIIFFPIVGGIAWLVAGRPQRRRDPNGWHMGSGFPEYERTRRAPRGPDDDPDFLSEMGQINNEQEETLRKWEADLARREAEQRRKESGTEE
jgi:phospholipase D-like protein